VTLAASLAGCGGSSSELSQTALTSAAQGETTGSVLLPTAQSPTAQSPIAATARTATGAKPVASAALGVGKGNTPTGAAPAGAGTVTGDQFNAYKIGPQDVLDITVFKVPDLTKSVQVADSGTISLPLVGEIQAAGKSAQDVEKELTRQLGGKYLNNPQVSVLIKEYVSQRVTIDGAVKKPGSYPLRINTSLLQSVALAEGIQHEIASQQAVVVRHTGKTQVVARFDLEAIRSGQAKDPGVQPGDHIIIEASQAKVTFNNVTKMLPLLNVFVPLL
jgi:polysaccharide biosynthesis/export protein